MSSNRDTDDDAEIHWGVITVILTITATSRLAILVIELQIVEGEYAVIWDWPRRMFCLITSRSAASRVPQKPFHPQIAVLRGSNRYFVEQEKWAQPRNACDQSLFPPPTTCGSSLMLGSAHKGKNWDLEEYCFSWLVAYRTRGTVLLCFLQQK